MKKVIITSLTNDRPGIVAAISSSLFKSDCNILQVRQAALGNEFAGIFIAEVPDALSEDQLLENLETHLAGQDISLQVKPLSQQSEPVEKESVDPFVVTTFGPDSKGIVAGVTEVIARHNANVTNLRALFRGGDNPEDNLMVYEIDIPESANLQALSADLHKLGKQFSLDINIQHQDIFNKLTKI